MGWKRTGNDDDLGVGVDLVGVEGVKVEEVVGADGAVLDDGVPGGVLVVIGLGGLEADAVGVVAAVVGGVDLGLEDVALGTELDHDVVAVAGGARTLGLPAITHVLAAARQEQVAAGRVVLVAGEHSLGAVANVGKVDHLTV